MLAIFEDRGIDLAGLRRHVASRIHMFPRLRQKLAFVPGGAAHPLWVDDEAFDIARHIDTEPLMNGADDAAARRMTALVMREPLPRSRPLWQMLLFRMTEGRVGLIVKIHHCLLDGMSAVRLTMVLFDNQHQAAGGQPPAWTPARSPSRAQLVAQARTEARLRWRRTRARVGALLERAAERQPLMRRASEVVTSMAQLALASFDSRHRLVLPRQGGQERAFATASLELDAVKQVRRRHTTKLNDVVLASVASGLGALLRARGMATAGTTVKAAVPVSRRDAADTASYGNKVSMMVVDLPVDEQPPDAQLCRISRTMTQHKQAGQADGANFWLDVAEYVPATLVSLVTRAASWQRLLDVIVTNVPGPQFPLYLGGGEMLEVFPFVPLFGGTRLGVALVSYNGRLFFGICGDRAGTPDVDDLSQAIVDSFDALHNLPQTTGATNVANDQRCRVPSGDVAEQA